MTTPDTPLPLDSRRHAFRPDLAAEALRGRISAPRYVAGRLQRVALPVAPLRRKPETGAMLETEALFGEPVTVYDQGRDWAWVQLGRDGYVGYLPVDALGEVDDASTHTVRALGTFVYPQADIKAPPLASLPLGARLTVRSEDDRFARITTTLPGSATREGFVVRRHLSLIDRPALDFVDIAERFVGTPYLWGGKSRLGIDCSGLVQVALDAAGVAVPRDTDMQEAEVGVSVLVPDTLDGLERGDLVFWRGHVGIMADGIMLVHANGHHMSTVSEPLAEAAERIQRTGSRISSVKRLARKA